MTEKSYKVPCLTYTRVVGYFSNTKEFNKGKKEEFKERVVYKLPQEELSLTEVR